MRGEGEADVDGDLGHLPHTSGKTVPIWRWIRETKPARGAASISDAASSLDVQSLPERGSRVVSLLVKAVVCISRETQLRNCYAWQTHRA